MVEGGASDGGGLADSLLLLDHLCHEALQSVSHSTDQCASDCHKVISTTAMIVAYSCGPYMHRSGRGDGWRNNCKACMCLAGGLHKRFVSQN